MYIQSSRNWGILLDQPRPMDDEDIIEVILDLFIPKSKQLTGREILLSAWSAWHEEVIVLEKECSVMEINDYAIGMHPRTGEILNIKRDK